MRDEETTVRRRGRQRDDTTLRMAEAAGISRRTMQYRLKREREREQCPIDTNGATPTRYQIEALHLSMRRWKAHISAARAIARSIEDFGADVPIDAVLAWLGANRPGKICGKCQGDEIRRMTCANCNGRGWEP